MNIFLILRALTYWRTKAKQYKQSLPHMSEHDDKRMPVAYEPSQKKRGVLHSIKEMINSDSIVYGIAAGCVAGVILFFFQGLQPIILRSYVIEKKSDLLTLQDAYSGQISSVNDLQTTFGTKFSYSLGDLCKNQARYTSFTADADYLEGLKVTLLNSPKPTTRKSAGSLNEVQAQYDKVYSVYATNMDTVRKVANGFQGIPSYLNYINSMIESCQLLEESSGLNSEVNKLCTLVSEAFKTYDASTKPYFWDQIAEMNTRELALCSKLGQLPATGFLKSFNTFKLDWISNYTQMRIFVPDFFTQLEPINTQAEAFGIAFDAADTEFLAILKYRKSFGGMWYLLHFGK